MKHTRRSALTFSPTSSLVSSTSPEMKKTRFRNTYSQKPRVFLVLRLLTIGVRHNIRTLGVTPYVLERDSGPRPVTRLTGGRGWTTSESGHLHTVSNFYRDHGC